MTNHCPTCQKAVETDSHACPSCRTPYHTECYRSSRCVVPGCAGVTRVPAAGQLGYSERWGWVTKVNLAVVAVLIASILRGKATTHLVHEGFFGMLGFVICMLSAAGTYHACNDDLNKHPLPDGTQRPDHYGSLAWMTYMAAVIALYLGLFSIFIPFLGFVGVPASFIFAIPTFAIGFFISLFALYKDAHKLRGALGVPFPLVAMVMSSVALSPLIGLPGASRERANTRACYANQKTVVGAVEMYNLDWDKKRPKIEKLDQATWDVLKSGGYLQSIPQDPGKGPGSEENYLMMNTGNGIGCKVHGTIQ